MGPGRAARSARAGWREEGTGKGPSEKGSGVTGSGEAGGTGEALIWGRVRLKDRAVEGSRDGWAILELGRFGIQSGISGLSTEGAPTVSLALGQPDRTREAMGALPWWERQAQRITWAKGLEPGN